MGIPHVSKYPAEAVFHVPWVFTTRADIQQRLFAASEAIIISTHRKRCRKLFDAVEVLSDMVYMTAAHDTKNQHGTLPTRQVSAGSSSHFVLALNATPGVSRAVIICLMH